MEQKINALLRQLVETQAQQNVIIEQILALTNSTREMNDGYPDFSMWKQNAIKTESGLIFAPEDFYVCDEQGRRKEHFSWNEAMDYERRILRPNGWRLPTRDEWEDAIKDYPTTERLVSALNLNYNGWQDGHEVIRNRGSNGYYWSSTAYGNTLAYYLYFNSSSVGPGTDYSYLNYKYYGYAVRCVAIDPTEL